MQKNDSKFDTVIHGWTDDPVLCPVLQWARLVNRIWSYEGTSDITPICTFQRSGRQVDKITSSQILQQLRAAARSVGSATLGFEPKEIGTHSLRSGAAMDMYLAGVPVYTIMLIFLADGRATHFCVIFGSKWSSSCATSRNKCSRSDRFERSLKSRHE
jgi:hypothetical protein